MDFHFVPNLTFGPDFINEIKKLTNKQLWVHLMVDNPMNWLDILNLKENDIFCFHYEALEVQEQLNLINKIHSKKLLASIAIKPQTKIQEIEKLLSKIDQVLIMSVEPGFSGQKFIKDTIIKVKELHKLKQLNNFNFRIAMDGGINENNIASLSQLGVQDFAIASAIFSTENPINAIQKLYALLK